MRGSSDYVVEKGVLIRKQAILCYNRLKHDFSTCYTIQTTTLQAFAHRLWLCGHYHGNADACLDDLEAASMSTDFRPTSVLQEGLCGVAVRCVVSGECCAVSGQVVTCASVGSNINWIEEPGVLYSDAFCPCVCPAAPDLVSGVVRTSN